MEYHVAKIKEIVKLSSGKKGKTNSDQMLLRDNVMTAVAPSPNSYTSMSAPSMKESIEFLGMKYRENKRKLYQRAMGNRGKIKVASATRTNPKWITLLQRKWLGHQKLTDEIKEKVVQWIRSHEHVVESPLFGDTILKKDRETGEKRRVPKLLLEIPVRELHNSLVSDGGLEAAIDASTGKAVISNTALRTV
jgi:hypothetical protein